MSFRGKDAEYLMPALREVEMSRQRAEEDHKHCYHVFRGVIFMVVPDGHIVQKCCKCEAQRVIHTDHAHE